jgi:LuxR family transcriptional regulator, maltose regulon positive regulatory protein
MTDLALPRQPAGDADVRPTGTRAAVVPLQPAGAGAEVVPLRPGAVAAFGPGDPVGRGICEPVIRREALFERLAAAGPVTIAAGPAGSGKTWLLRSWLADACLDGRAAWITAGRDERDGQRFWGSAIHALAGIAEHEPAASISEARGSRTEALAERLLRTVQAIDAPAVLVIDDLQELQSADALAVLERFLGHLPGQLRVVLLTRVDPCLGAHRLRLGGALTEIRAADLRFSLEETRELLAASGVTLPDDAAAALHECTEGWAAGLRLATMSLAGHPDPERFVAEFCGSERMVASFLQAEVLDRQPPEVRDLLLRTSVLERVSGPLADALTGGSGSLRILEDLDEANAFVAAEDVGRAWFRYHPMFADLLRRKLRRLDPGLERPLHRAAARWFERHGLAIDAVRHAQSAGDWADAARLLADHQLELTLDGRGAEVRDLLATFPADGLAADAELALALATVLLADGLREAAATQLAVAERLTATVHADRRPRFDLSLAATRLRVACARGDMGRLPCAADATETALKAQLPSDVRRTQTHRAAALVDLGIAELWLLRLGEARSHLEHALELARRVQRPSIEIACLAYLALEATLSGRPASVARPLVEQAASLVETYRCDTDESAAATFAVGGMTLVWLGRLVEAEQWLERAEGALTPATPPALALLVQHTRALLRLGQQRLDDALTAIRDAERLQAQLVSEHPVALDLRGRLLRGQVRLGETAAVRAALDGMGEDERGRGEIRIAAAALELSEGRAREAADELRPVIEGTAPARCCAWAAAIEARLYAAAAGRELGDPSGAEAALEGALALAEPEGTLLPFALVPVGELLEGHGGHRTAHATLLSTIRDRLAGSSGASDADQLLDPLSDAELRVVRYLPGNLKGPEIAAELCVSPNTVRTHLRHIYAKLDAHSRSEAVGRARRLGLLAPA